MGDPEERKGLDMRVLLLLKNKFSEVPSSCQMETFDEIVQKGLASSHVAVPKRVPETLTYRCHIFVVWPCCCTEHVSSLLLLDNTNLKV